MCSVWLTSRLPVALFKPRALSCLLSVGLLLGPPSLRATVRKMRERRLGRSISMAGSGTLPPAERTMPSASCCKIVPARTRPDLGRVGAKTTHAGSPLCQHASHSASAARSCRSSSGGVSAYLLPPFPGNVRLLAAAPALMLMGFIAPVALVQDEPMAGTLLAWGRGSKFSGRRAIVRAVSG